MYEIGTQFANGGGAWAETYPVTDEIRKAAGIISTQGAAQVKPVTPKRRQEDYSFAHNIGGAD